MLAISKQNFFLTKNFVQAVLSEQTYLTRKL